MVIEKVHGLQATGMSLNDRFTMLQSAAPDRVAARPRRRPSVNSYFSQNLNFKNRNLVDHIARRLEFEAKRQALRQRLGALRRFGSESSLPGLRRSNSFGNLSQSSFKQRLGWRRNGNIRSTSFENVSQAWRGFRRRGGGARALRGRFRGRGVRRGAARAGAVGGVQRVRPQRATMMRGRARANGLRGRARGLGGRGGGILRNQAQKPVPTKEELDDQLDRYMAGSRAALDKELDQYMKNAMEME